MSNHLLSNILDTWASRLFACLSLVPSAPNPPKVKAANNQSHPSAVSISWSAPERQAGPLDMYNIEMKFPAEKESRLLNSSTSTYSGFHFRRCV